MQTYLQANSMFKLTVIFFFFVNLISCSKESSKIENLDVFVIVKKATTDSELFRRSKPINVSTASNWVLTDNAGWVVEKLVENGDIIKAGETILRLDPRDLRLSDSSARFQYEAAKASLKAHRADFLRFSELKTKKFISDAEWERRKAQLSMYEAEFEELADKLGVISVRSFGDGKVTNLFVKEGQLLKAGEKVARILLSKTIISRDYENRSIQKDDLKSSIKIPISALIDGQLVFKVSVDSGNKQIRSGTGFVHEVRVSTGEINESSVVITDGLKKGDMYVVSGGHLLTEGQKVRFAY